MRLPARTTVGWGYGMTQTGMAAVVCVTLLGGCAALQQDAVRDRENLLSAAGFSVRPATTPVQQQALARLPANVVSQRIEGEHVSYLYPDPLICHCLYVGGQEAFGRYQQILTQRQIANAQLQAAQLNSDFAWDWGPWGGYGPAFY